MKTLPVTGVGRYPIERPDEKLTYRQREVVRLIALGETNLSIGARLGISRHTVDKHRRALLALFDVGCAIDLLRAIGYLRVPS